MRTWLLPARYSGRTLTRQFGVLSLAVTVLITAGLCLVITHFLRKDLLEREWHITADFIRTEATHHLRASDFADPSTPEAARHFQTFYQQVVLMPEIVRVKIYDADMAVLWSDEPRLLGQRFPDNPHLRGALGGQVTVNIPSGGAKGEHVYERDRFPRVVEVYVPLVFPDSPRVVGAVETYKAPAQVFANIRQGQITVFATVLAAAAFLYASLFWIVRHAGRRLDDQHRELERSNQELRALQTQLLEAERMAAIGEVVTAVAHGIRNPLANIRAAAQVAALEGGQGGPAPKRLASIIGEVDRLEVRLRELLLFVRPAERPREVLDLNSVLRECLTMMNGRLAKSEIKVDERLAAGLPHIAGDAILLEQVFLSLIGNAIEAIPGRGVITITTGVDRDASDRARVFAEIQDTGPGIAGEPSRLFQPFYTTKAQGTGLGLAIARKFTEAHGGTIAVTSGPGEGARFRVSFPAPAEDA
jgi:signal transduction histidine kinase